MLLHKGTAIRLQCKYVPLFNFSKWISERQLFSRLQIFSTSAILKSIMQRNVVVSVRLRVDRWNLCACKLMKYITIIYFAPKSVDMLKLILICRPRSHHLPSLYSKPRTVPSSGNSIEKPIRLQMLSLQDRILIARSLYELQNSFMTNSTTSSNSTNSKVSISTDKSMQNTI